MTLDRPTFQPGTLVTFRDRDWIVLPESRGEHLYLRTLAGSETDRTLIHLGLEAQRGQLPRPAVFPPPTAERVANQQQGLLLHHALMLKLRSGAGPFRAMGNVAVEPRAYQLAPLLMALKHPFIRLLIADEVGIGKTIEAGLIVRELLDRGEISRFSVLCPPHLCDQWRMELARHFHLRARVVRSSTVRALEAESQGRGIFEHYPFTVVSLDYIKSDKRRDEYINHCPELVITDEAHGCVEKGTGGRQQRFELLTRLAADPERHMLFLTATPHAGDSDAFYNLLGLLKPEFHALKDLENEKQRARLREQLRDHFIQRGRREIDLWHEQRIFPKLVERDGKYVLTKPFQRLVDAVHDYARGSLSHGSERADERRLNWWGALALLRCIASSPAAAEDALRRRDQRLAREQILANLQAAEARMKPVLTDGRPDEDEAEDATPDVPHEHDPDTLDFLANEAARLKGPSKDPKLKHLIEEVKTLHRQGFNPVIFCRYLKTVEYVAEHLRATFKRHHVAEITGALAPAQRERIVAELPTEREPILVASDCLSEGVNLQERFNAVIHYDLAWNPNRHAQRVGRVDRFGQKSDEVAALMIYSEDNAIDGAVLEVILRKAAEIREALGVLVPLPVDRVGAGNAIMRAALFRGKQADARDQFLPGMDPVDLHSEWERARENEARKKGYLFAQARIKYEDVLPEWQRSLEVLGDSRDTERFFRRAAQALGAPLHPDPKREGIFQLPIDHLEADLLARVRYEELDHIRAISFQFPVPRGVHYIHRAHPLCHLLADHIAEKALEDAPDGLARCGALYSNAAGGRATVVILRLRLRLEQKVRGVERSVLAEETLGMLRSRSEMRLLEKRELGDLLGTAPGKDMSKAEQQRQVSAALAKLDSDEVRTFLAEAAAARASQLQSDHERVRKSFDRYGKCSVTPHQPDIIGVYELRPLADLG